jgi:ParB family chromosome partitioning protein
MTADIGQGKIVAPEAADAAAVPVPSSAASSAELTRRLASSPRLRQRRFQMLPLRGPDAVFTEAQGRAPGDSSTPAGLADLISSIASVGVLQPILVEERPPTGAATSPTRLLVAGERRLRAARWGAVHLADNTHFDAIPAVICPGPLAEEDRRVWQLIENLAREDLRPGELAAALLFERCAVLVPRLLAAGRDVPSAVFTQDDPVQRWQALERIRGRDTTIGAPWEEVLHRLGLQLSDRKARQLHQALASLPPEMSAQMDAERISLTTRLRLAALDRGRTAAGSEIWEAVRAAGRPDLLPGALLQRQDHPDLGPDEALEAADAVRTAGNAARAAALARPAETAQGGAAPVPDSDSAENRQPLPPVTSASASPPAAATSHEGDSLAADEPPSGDPASEEATVHLEPAQVAEVRRTLTDMLTHLRAGATLSRFDTGSLRLLAGELIDLLEASLPQRAETPRHRDVGTPRHLDTGTHRHRDVGTPRCERAQ